MFSCDVLVIGSGGAGLRAALESAKDPPRLSVMIISKTMPTRAATCMAEGGINGVLAFPGNKDTLADHERDTVVAAIPGGDRDAIRFFCRGGRPGRAGDRLLGDALQPNFRWTDCFPEDGGTISCPYQFCDG